MDLAVEEDLVSIAQALSDLSQQGRMPQGVTASPDFAPFDPDSVDFQSNDWLLKTLAVQGWLFLDSPVQANITAEAAAAQLFQQLSVDLVDSCVIAIEGKVQLSALGSQHLDYRLSRAVSHREMFDECLDDDQTLKEATEAWRLVWEEANSGQDKRPSSIKAEVKTMTIRTLADYGKEGELELNPSYQRDSVWSTADSQLLIDSILRGIPIPSIILTQIEGSDQLQIVDGKQRLTAILRFIGQHPSALAFAKENEVEKELATNPKRIISKLHLRGREIGANFLPFRLRRYTDQKDPLFPLSGKYYAEIRDLPLKVGQDQVKVRDIFEKAHSKYQIPVIIYERTRLRDIHLVFSIYNKQGKKLNAEELRNATYHHLGLTKLLLLLSGDRPDVEELARYLPTDFRPRIAEVGKTLLDRGFGTLRFKRTKVLSWACAIFLHAPNKSASGVFVTPSTASHIDALLIELSDNPGLLTLPQTLTTLASDIYKAVLLHSDANNAWSPKFRSKRGVASRWEELPLVGSLIASLVLAATDQGDRLFDAIEEVRGVTERRIGPEKTQNKTQWEYIAQSCLDILKATGIDLDAAEVVLQKRYGYSCIATLRSIAAAATQK
ncbi:MAG: DUF262 domain-containing protein [Rhodoferax sp.]